MGPRANLVRQAARRRRAGPVYVRFVCFHLVEGLRSRLGLFQAIDLARESPHAPQWALDLIAETNLWFCDRLPTPRHLTHVFARPSERSRWRGGLSWFKAEAGEHIARMYELKSALEACGVHVDVLTTRDPGRVIYAVAFQVAAQPGARRF